jgi:CheY-like chemotaxis protein
LVEDDEPLREILRETLQRGGYTVVEADTGRSAVKKLRLDHADIVLTDVVMPDQDGLEFITMLRKEHPEIPIVAMSGGLARSSLYLDLAKKLGARRVLAKPFTPEQMFAALKGAAEMP